MNRITKQMLTQPKDIDLQETVKPKQKSISRVRENDFKNIPKELKNLRQWVCFSVKQEINNKGEERLVKCPINPHTGSNAKINDPETWGPFRDAITGCQEYNHANIGFAFTSDDPYCGIDIDHCVNSDGTLSNLAQEILNLFQGTYVEFSTSGTGIHIIAKGTIGEDGRKDPENGIEIYKAKRFFVCTGDFLGDNPNPVLNQQDQIDLLYNNYFKRNEASNPISHQGSLSMSDNDIIEKAKKAKNGNKFIALYGGDISNNSDDHSSADLAFCRMLAFYTQDPSQIDRIFRSSGLSREKWINREDYRTHTITKAITSCAECYKPAGNNYQLNATTPKMLDEPQNSIKLKQETVKKPSLEKTSIFQPYTFQDLLTMPPKEWLIDQVFGAGDIGMIYGPPGCGKTFIVIDMILKMCSGEQWADRFAVSRKLNVAYCAGEGISGLPSRFTTSAKYYGISSLHNFTFYKTIPQLYNEKASADLSIANIQNFTAEWKARQQAKEADKLDVLVIDTLHTATTSADENSAQDMGKVLQACRLVADELCCIVILVHHTNKGGTAERGSSALRGAMDFMIEIKKQSEIGTDGVMSCSKLKDGEQWKDQSFDLRSVEGFDSVHVSWNTPNEGKPMSKTKADDKRNLLAEMERYASKSFTCKSLSEVIDQNNNYTQKLINELVEEKKCARRLSDPIKGASSRNPWVYFVEDFQAKRASL